MVGAQCTVHSTLLPVLQMQGLQPSAVPPIFGNGACCISTFLHPPGGSKSPVLEQGKSSPHELGTALTALHGSDTRARESSPQELQGNKYKFSDTRTQGN